MRKNMEIWKIFCSEDYVPEISNDWECALIHCITRDPECSSYLERHTCYITKRRYWVNILLISAY